MTRSMLEVVTEVFAASQNGMRGVVNTSSVKSTTTNESKTKPKHTPAGTAAYRNHLSCWRSSPHARCSRTKSEKSAARLLVNSSASPTRAEAVKNWYVVTWPPMTPTTPNG